MLPILRGKSTQALCCAVRCRPANSHEILHRSTQSAAQVSARASPSALPVIPYSAVRWASNSTERPPPPPPQQQKESTVSTSFASVFGTPSATPQPGRPRVKVVLGLLLLLAIGATSTSVYIYYASFSTWPSELREDLRAAVKAQQHGNHIRAAARFQKALDTASALPRDRLGDDALLKVSGISIALGAVYEEQGELRRAYDVYNDALVSVKKQATTPEERLRAVALAQRCGDLAGIQEVRDSFSLDSVRATVAAEHHLSWSVEELLRLAVPDETRQRILQGEQEAIHLSDLELPKWVSSTTLGASLEALGQLYAAQGKASYAVPLYVQAINLLMPPPPAGAEKRSTQPTVAERCRVGILMNNVAQLMVDANEHQGKAKVDDAQAWAMRGLDIVTFAMRGTGWDQKGGQGFKDVQESSDQRTLQVKGQCYAAEVALLLNLGELSRMKKDDCKAREFFQRAYVRADTYGMREARSRGAQALAELERTPSSAASRKVK